jgi:hypothetical protein
MKFKIRGLRDPGNLEKERVVIEALEDGDVGRLIVTTTNQQSATTVSPRIKTPYWIPDQTVKKGDLVVVYTKKGARNTKENDDNTSSHFFYMGSEQSLYNSDTTTAAVFNVASWSFAKRED